MEQMLFVALRPKKVARHLEERRREIRECDQKIRSFRHDLDGPELHRVFNADGTYTVRGFEMESVEEELPDGWMREGDSLVAVPDPHTYDGQRALQTMADLSPDIEFIPGMPWNMVSERNPVTGSRHRITPRINLSGGDYFLVLPEAPCAEDLAEIDPEYWELTRTPEVHFVDQRPQRDVCDV